MTTFIYFAAAIFALQKLLFLLCHSEPQAKNLDPLYPEPRNLCYAIVVEILHFAIAPFRMTAFLSSRAQSRDLLPILLFSNRSFDCVRFTQDDRQRKNEPNDK